MELNRKLYYGFVLLWAIALLIIVIWNSKGRIHFGLGLADMLISGLIVLCVLVVSTFVFIELKKGTVGVLKMREKVISIASILFFIYIILKMTILRGGESPWDGRIFF